MHQALERENGVLRVKGKRALWQGCMVRLWCSWLDTGSSPWLGHLFRHTLSHLAMGGWQLHLAFMEQWCQGTRKHFELSMALDIVVRKMALLLILINSLVIIFVSYFTVSHVSQKKVRKKSEKRREKHVNGTERLARWHCPYPFYLLNKPSQPDLGRLQVSHRRWVANCSVASQSTEKPC